MILKLKSCWAILLGRTSLAACYEVGYVAGLLAGKLQANVVKVKLESDTELN